MSNWDKPFPIFLVGIIFGWLAITYNQFPSFVVVLLAFIFAKQFEK